MKRIRSQDLNDARPVSNVSITNICHPDPIDRVVEGSGEEEEKFD